MTVGFGSMKMRKYPLSEFTQPRSGSFNMLEQLVGAKQ